MLADIPQPFCPIQIPDLPPGLNPCALVTVGQIQRTDTSTTSYAAFGNATINLSPSFRLLAGLRVGRESVRATTRATLGVGAVAPILSLEPIDGAINDSYVSYRIGAQVDVAPEVMLYATYTRGYKGPAVNDQTGTGNNPVIVNPEVPHAAEIGVKASALGGRVNMSLAAFYNRVDDFQAQFFDPTISAYVFSNAPSLTTQGVSINVTGRPVRALTVNFGALYNHATYGDGYLVPCAQGQTAAQGCFALGSGALVDDAGGNQLVGAPRWKLTGFAEYTVPFASFEAFGQIDAVYTSRINGDAAYSPENASAAAAIFGLRLGARTNDRRYGASIFVRNLFDIYRPALTFPTPTAREQLDPRSFAQISGPDSLRTIGLSLDMRF